MIDWTTPNPELLSKMREMFPGFEPPEITPALNDELNRLMVTLQELLSSDPNIAPDELFAKVINDFAPAVAASLVTTGALDMDSAVKELNEIRDTYGPN